MRVYWKLLIGVLMFSIITQVQLTASQQHYGLIWKDKITEVDVYSVAISEDGKYMAIGGFDGELYFYNLLEGEILWKYRELYTILGVSVAISRDGKYVVAGCAERLFFFNNTGGLIWFRDVRTCIECISMTPDASLIIVGDKEYVYAFDNKGNLLWETKLESTPTSLKLSEDGKLLAVGGGRRLYLLDGRTGDILWQKRVGRSTLDIALVDGSKNLDYILVGIRGSWWSPPCTVYLFDRYGTELWHFVSNLDYLYSITCSDDASLIAIRTNKYVFLLDKDGRELAKIWEIDIEYIRGVALSSDGDLVAVVFEKKDNTFVFEIMNNKGEKLWRYEEKFPEGYLFSHYYYMKATPDLSIIIVVPRSCGQNYYIFGDLAKYSSSVIQFAQDVIQEIKSQGANTTQAEAYLLQAEHLHQSGKYADAVKRARDAIHEARAIYKLWLNAKEEIDKAEEAIRNAKSQGIVVVEIEKLFNQTLNAFKQGNYQVAYQLALEVQSKVKSIIRDWELARISINSTKSFIEEVESYEVNVEAAKSLLKQAEEKFLAGEYKEAKGLADEAYNLAEEALHSTIDEASKAYEMARDAVLKSSLAGYNTKEAEDLLARARIALESRKYRTAIELAQKAYQKAIDVDNDGIPNDTDPFPTINNIIIYGSIAGVILIVVLLVMILKRRKRKSKTMRKKQS